MARRYGSKIKTQRKWKKIARMNFSELKTFIEHLKKFKQENSKVYDHAMIRMEQISGYV